MTRKATDVLLNIEREVQLHGQYLRNIDMLLKTLANRIAGMGKVQAQPPITAPGLLPDQQQPKKTLMPGLKSSVIMAEGKLGNLIEEFPTHPGSDSEFSRNQTAVDSQPIGQRRDLRYTEDPGEPRKIPVQQRLLYAGDGKSITSAKVEVYGSDNKLINASKTNNTGQWTQFLPAGNYIVMVSRKGTSTKPPIEASFPIEVPDSNESVPLPPIEL